MKLWRLSVLLLGFIVTLGVGVYAGYRIFRPVETAPRITSQAILTALRDRGFLVTQTYVFDEPVTIDKKSGSAFKDFFFGQKITARGAMEVNLGIDLANMTVENITIQDDTIHVRIPRASVFTVRLIGPLDVKNEQGVLKRLIENENGYNEAQAELARIAEETAKQPQFLDRASENAVSEITRLLGYVTQGKQITVSTLPQ